MRQNRFPVIDGDGQITERSREILEDLGSNKFGEFRATKVNFSTRGSTP